MAKKKATPKKELTASEKVKARFALATAPKADPKYLNIPNINFSLTDPHDEREPRFQQQRMERGFDDTETWCLSATIANFVLPRLKRHREIIEGTIVNEGELYEDIDRAIRAFELAIKDTDGGWMTKTEWKEFQRGMKSFGRVYMRLWW